MALAHYAISWLRSRSPGFARLIDGTPLVLLGQGYWRKETLAHMHIEDVDVMFVARDRGVLQLSAIDQAILERNGDISILPGKASGAAG